MNPSGRILPLAAAIVLLVVGILCLRDRFSAPEAPPAFVPAAGLPAESRPGRLTHQPTVLSTDPNSEGPVGIETRWRPVDAIPPPTPNPEINYPERGHDPAMETTSSVPGPTSNGTTSRHESTYPSTTYEAMLQPEPLPVAEIPVAQPAQPQVVVTSMNDSLWVISEKIYGDAGFYRALYAFNQARLPQPDRIVAGIELETPPVAVLRQLYPALCPPPGLD